jgi:predicted transcriptional regulator
METIPISAERKAQLEVSARQQGKEPAQVADEALAAWLDWEREDFEATVAAVKEGYADFEAGRSRPAEDVLRDLRRKHGIPD